ncbi:MAG: diguanylate cyclase, partial [Clostridiaceae bacterium]|nr:diguanylate cyclase [Clostridiaceae bacterium]
QQQRYVSGFEEGRIFNGYRFVYPLRYDDKHIGTVEVSISMDYLMSLLNQLYPENDLYFMLRADLVENIVFEEMQDNYRQSPFSPDYLFDKAVGTEADKYRQNFSLNDSLNSKIESAAREHLQSQGDFGVFVQDDERDIEVRFLSIKNIVGEQSGYIVSLREDKNYGQMRFDYTKDIILITLILVMFLVLSFFYNRERLRLQKLSFSDFLTGINNRYMFLRQADKEFERYLRYGSVFSIAMIDIDYFKKVNDTYGHNEGDFVLRELTRIINDNLRKTDIFARWGGEEFVVMMPETRLEGAYSAAEKLRSAIACHQFGAVGRVTISLGVAMITEQDKSLELLISRADTKLYDAKKAGRNRTET